MSCFSPTRERRKYINSASLRDWGRIFLLMHSTMSPLATKAYVLLSLAPMSLSSTLLFGSAISPTSPSPKTFTSLSVFFWDFRSFITQLATSQSWKNTSASTVKGTSGFGWMPTCQKTTLKAMKKIALTAETVSGSWWVKWLSWLRKTHKFWILQWNAGQLHSFMRAEATSTLLSGRLLNFCICMWGKIALKCRATASQWSKYSKKSMELILISVIPILMTLTNWTKTICSMGGVFRGIRKIGNSQWLFITKPPSKKLAILWKIVVRILK